MHVQSSLDFQKYFIHFTYGPMLIFNPINRTFDTLISLLQWKLQQICCHTPERKFSKEFNRKNCIQIRLKSKKLIILCVGHFWLHLTLETTRATGKSNLVEKMQARNYIKEKNQTLNKNSKFWVLAPFWSTYILEMVGAIMIMW